MLLVSGARYEWGFGPGLCSVSVPGGRGLFKWRNAASGARTWAVGGVCGRGVYSEFLAACLMPQNYQANFTTLIPAPSERCGWWCDLR